MATLLEAHPDVDLLIAGTPDIRGAMTPALRSWLARVKPPRFWIMVVTYGVPVWGNISAAVCAMRSRRFLGAKFVGWFARPGRHAKFGTFRGRPTPRDLEKDTRFGRELRDSRLLKRLLSGF
jgi:hypothetical protein